MGDGGTQRGRVKEIFFEVSEAPFDQKPEMLDRLCGGDAAVREQVERLLRNDTDEGDGGFLSPILGAGLGSALGAAAVEASLAEAEGFEPVGEIAGCRVVRKVGEGGMGAVYECEQQTPRRRVAIKLVKPGLNTPAIQRRFRQEAEILGHLRHPNIAQVYGAGTTEIAFKSGAAARSSFLMMEFIEGRPLTTYAREHNLGVAARLELMAQVCDAVQHAHSKGVIHRDLKPANILVEPAESGAGVGNARVLDFGIARLTDDSARGATMRTQQGQLSGTLAYMSPEQVEGDGAAIDTRSDVYALGVTMYELLSARLPLAVESTSLAEAARMIRDEEPQPLARASPEFRGDLSTIVAKAMRKVREDRYQTAAEMAADIRRFLAKEPISARPATAAYVLRKFAQRNKALTGALGVCLLLLVGGVAGTTAGLVSSVRANDKLGGAIIDANQQRDRARESEARATTELARSQQVTKLMRSMLMSVNPAMARDRDTTLLREILDTALKRLDSGELAQQPAVEAELRATIAESLFNLGDNAASLRVIEPAIRLARAAPAEQKGQFQRVRIYYATILVHWGRYQDAKVAYEEALEVQESAALPENELAGQLYADFGGLQSRLGNPEAALELHKRSLAVRLRINGEKSGSTAAAKGNIAGVLQTLGRLDESLAIMREVLQTYKDMSPQPLVHITIVENNTAGLLLEMNRPREAEELLRDALDIGGRIYQPNHQQMGMANHTLAAALRAQKKHEEALGHFTAAATILRAAFDDKHPFVATARFDLGVELVTLSRYAEAEPELLAAHAILAGSGGAADTSAAECATAIADMYTRWETADPGKGHADKAAEWRARGRAGEKRDNGPEADRPTAP